MGLVETVKKTWDNAAWYKRVGIVAVAAVGGGVLLPVVTATTGLIVAAGYAGGSPLYRLITGKPKQESDDNKNKSEKEDPLNLSEKDREKIRDMYGPKDSNKNAFTLTDDDKKNINNKYEK